jgi:hypothetical protein
LTKQQQALVNAQLEKEAVVRKKVQKVKDEMARGLEFLRSLVESRVTEFLVFVTEVLDLLLEGALKLAERGSDLVGEAAFEIYLVGGAFKMQIIVHNSTMM